MKKILFMLCCALLPLAASAEKVQLSTPNNTLVLDVWKGGEPKFVYYGAKLSADDFASLPAPTNANWSHLDIYPAYGATHTMSETAFAMRHADGNMSTQLLVEEYGITAVDEQAPNGKPRKGSLLTIKMKDPLYPTYVNLYYFAYSDVDMIECWTDITNGEKKTVALTQFYSSCMPIRRGNVWINHFHGSWAAEAQMVEEELNNGLLRIKNKD